MDNFKIEVPISVKGDTSGKKFGEGIAEQIKKSLSSIGIGGKGKSAQGIGGAGVGKGIGKMTGWLALIAAAVEGLSFILKPIMDLFKVILMLLFLPLVPILKPVMQGLAAFIKWFAPVMKKVSKWVEKFVGILGEGLSWIWENLLKPIWDGLKNAILAGWEMLKNAGVWIWDNIIVPGFSAVLNFGIWIWDMIVLGLKTISDLGVKLWNFIKGLFIGTIEVGVTLWGWFKGLFKGTISVASTVWNWFKGLFGGSGGGGGSGNKEISFEPYDPHSSWNDFMSRPGQSPVSFSPQDTIIGVKDVSKLGGKSITVNINNSSVRNDMDIKKIANQVSQILQRQVSGRVSQ